MKQYCRYCTNAVLIDEGMIYCEAKKETRLQQNCITLNKCKDFDFNEMDVFDIEKIYQPRKVKKSLENQIKMEEV